MRGHSQVQQSVSPTPQTAHDPVSTGNFITGALVITLPLLFMIGIVVHRKRRAVLWRRRIEALEKLWLLDSTKKTP